MDNNKGEPWDVSDAIPFTATSSQYWQQQWTSASGCWGGDDVDSDDDDDDGDGDDVDNPYLYFDILP